MFQLPHNCTHFTCQQINAQNSPNQASTVHELRNSRCSSWIQKRQRNQRSNCHHLLDHRKSKRIPEKTSFASLTAPKPLTMWITTNWKILQVRLQLYMNQELPDVQAGFQKKAEEPEIKLQTFIGSQRKQGNSRRTSISVSLTTTTVSTTNC